MNEFLKKYSKKLKNPKTVIAVGLCGILLIFVSSFFPAKNQSEQKQEAEQTFPSAENYRKELEEQLQQTVVKISGDQNATVLVTLESGFRYTYADTTEDNSADGSNQNSRSTSKSAVKIRHSDGGEEALLITQAMPEIRGVTVICRNGDDETVAEKIRNTVQTSLNITSKRVYIAGGNGNEKR